jgi:serine/threonine protein phosphatase PrpC
VEIQFFVATDVGRQRKHNEDNYLIDPELRLFVVADGMGGHAAGEVASQIAVHAVSRALRQNRDLIERYRTGKTDNVAQARHEILALVEHAVQAACMAVYRAGQEDAARRGMGTTTCALLLVGDRGFIAHVGDSRIYLLRQNELHQITEDHSLINELVKRGKIKREEFDASPYARYRNAVTRAVGANESVEVDTLDFELLPGDCFLLCSDGLYFYLDNPVIAEVLAREELNQTPRDLVGMANAGGGHDNITALVVRILEEASQEEIERVSDLTNRVEVLESLTLFQNLSYKEIIRILNCTEVRRYEPGELIIREGEPGEELYVILGGKVSLHKGNSFLTFLERGAHFGEMALIDSSPLRSATAVAVEPTKMLLLHSKDFYDIVTNEPPLATKLLWSFLQVLSERLRKTTTELSGARLAAEPPP